MIERHAELTGSTRAREVLDNWDKSLPKFIKVLPKDYKRVLMAMDRVIASGLSGDEAVMAAFEENARDLARVGGN
jgi:glutamate synthase (ferredoxin)